MIHQSRASWRQICGRSGDISHQGRSDAFEIALSSRLCDQLDGPFPESAVVPARQAARGSGREEREACLGCMIACMLKNVNTIQTESVRKGRARR
eukprot:2462678-Pleurochrysis_carterae.AAC.1